MTKQQYVQMVLKQAGFNVDVLKAMTVTESDKALQDKGFKPDVITNFDEVLGIDRFSVSKGVSDLSKTPSTPDTQTRIGEITGRVFLNNPA